MAHSHLAGGVRDVHAAGDPAAQQLTVGRREPCVRMLGHAMALFAASLDNSLHAGATPICHFRGVNNVLAHNN